MIYDTIKNYQKYICLHESFQKAFDFLISADSDIANGKYTIDGEKLFALVQRYDTQDKVLKKMETHEKYIDIQYIMNGKETIYWGDSDLLELQTVYDPQNDITFCSGKENAALFMQKGHFVIFYPKEGHMPSCIYESSQKVKKIVVKILAR